MSRLCTARHGERRCRENAVKRIEHAYVLRDGERIKLRHYLCEQHLTAWELHGWQDEDIRHPREESV